MYRRQETIDFTNTSKKLIIRLNTYLQLELTDAQCRCDEFHLLRFLFIFFQAKKKFRTLLHRVTWHNLERISPTEICVSDGCSQVVSCALQGLRR